jgi:hypothetical protein
MKHVSIPFASKVSIKTSAPVLKVSSLCGESRSPPIVFPVAKLPADKDQQSWLNGIYLVFSNPGMSLKGEFEVGSFGRLLFGMIS